MSAPQSKFPREDGQMMARPTQGMLRYQFRSTAPRRFGGARRSRRGTQTKEFQVMSLTPGKFDSLVGPLLGGIMVTRATDGQVMAATGNEKARYRFCSGLSRNHLVFSGSPTWARTRDLRINSKQMESLR